MANHPSAAKRNRQSVVRQARNAALRSRMRKAVKDARQALAEGAEDREARVKEAVSRVYRAASHSIIKDNTASRHVARLMKALAAR